jgi:Zn-dependent protease
MKFTRSEINQLLIAWLVMGLCFTFITRDLMGGLYTSSYIALLMSFMVSLIAVGLGFVGHELAHKYVAQRYGYWAEFRLWRTGLIIALVTALITAYSPVGFVFAAPGAVYVMSHARPRENGYISASGPVVNLVLAALFYLLTGTSGIPKIIGYVGFQVNLWLAAFNLLPIGPMDGRAVMSFSMKLWVVLVILSWGTLAANMFGLIPFFGQW